jgi:hypothetical protein
LPAPGLGRLVALFSRKLCGPDCGPQHNGDALARLISHPTANGQWSALTSLLNVLPQAREPDTRRATNAIIDLIDAGAARGLTVSHLAQTVVQVQSEEDVGPQFFEHVRARLGATA